MTSLPNLILTIVFGGLVAASGCAVELDPVPKPGGQLEASGITPNRLLEDVQVEGDQEVTVAQIQALLVDQGSALAGYVEDGRSAADWIVSESKGMSISPVYMVARIETESGLIRSGTSANIASATGCACPDGTICDPAVAGFGLQVRCAAELMRSYLNDLDQVNMTVSGWSVGAGRSTLDPCWVVPENRATAALYTYTPWVGAYADGCGTWQWGGSSLAALLVQQFASALPTDSAPPVCSYGNGNYCGGNGVEGDTDSLYLCENGEVTLIEACSNGCLAAPPGEQDTCVSATECPSGNGNYCGGNGVGGEVDSLYACADGELTLIEACNSGCEAAPPGENDTCAAECPSGDGLYCGGNGVGGDVGSLYQCSAGALELAEVCTEGCSSMEAGVADACL